MSVILSMFYFFFFFKQKTAYELRISDWSSDVCSSDLAIMAVVGRPPGLAVGHQRGEVGLQRLIVDRLKRLRIIEILAHRIGRGAILGQDVERQRVGPPILARATEQSADQVLAKGARAEESRVGREGVGTCRNRGSQNH